mmetsp:Transcript_8128/g.22475  ORF Transcript_8128/g.22475 Transcript_8128/m.22475 type:complete len:265 (+) Transcript_8128:1502-2296(+)
MMSEPSLHFVLPQEQDKRLHLTSRFLGVQLHADDRRNQGGHEETAANETEEQQKHTEQTFLGTNSGDVDTAEGQLRDGPVEAVDIHVHLILVLVPVHPTVPGVSANPRQCTPHANRDMVQPQDEEQAGQHGEKCTRCPRSKSVQNFFHDLGESHEAQEFSEAEEASNTENLHRRTYSYHECPLLYEDVCNGTHPIASEREGVQGEARAQVTFAGPPEPQFNLPACLITRRTPQQHVHGPEDNTKPREAQQPTLSFHGPSQNDWK